MRNKWLLWLLILGLGCGGTTVLLPTATMVAPAATPTLLPPPTVTPVVPDSGWQLLRPGLEHRLIQLLDDEGLVRERLYLIRIDPAGYQFGVGYRPGQPQSLSDWQAETGALLVVNGGYFTPEYLATGLIVADGQANGVSYEGFGGMFAVTPAGPSLRWLPDQPYDPSEPLLAAIQSFPVLVRPGGQLGFPDEDNQPSRRTVVAQDVSGRVLFLLTLNGQFTLHGLSQYLTTSDLQLHIALNLDGGTSSGLLLADPPQQFLALALLPAVITIHPR